MNESEVKESPKMRPIWYFVGWMLAVIGITVVVSGIINLIRPPEHETVLSHLHTNLWWGAVIFVFGLILLTTHRRSDDS